MSAKWLDGSITPELLAGITYCDGCGGETLRLVKQHDAYTAVFRCSKRRCRNEVWLALSEPVAAAPPIDQLTDLTPAAEPDA